VAERSQNVPAPARSTFLMFGTWHCVLASSLAAVLLVAIQLSNVVLLLKFNTFMTQKLAGFSAEAGFMAGRKPVYSTNQKY
jgi:hypothetical protein